MSGVATAPLLWHGAAWHAEEGQVVITGVEWRGQERHLFYQGDRLIAVDPAPQTATSAWVRGKDDGCAWTQGHANAAPGSR